MAATLRPAFASEAVSVYQGDARSLLVAFADECVDCVVTSPPYWGLRNFEVAPGTWGGDQGCRHRWSHLQRGRRKDLKPASSTQRSSRVGLTQNQNAAATDGGRFCMHCDAWLGSLGQEPTPELFVTHLVEIFREVRRVLKPTGTLWLNLGDSFCSGPRARCGEMLKPKDLIGIPWRVALALQADGWYLRSDIVWHKPNPTPEPSRDRPIRAHEFVFLLTKTPSYFYDAEAVREPAVSRPSKSSWPMPAVHAGKYSELNAPQVRAVTKYLRRDAPQSTSRHRRSVWVIPTEPFRGAHTATFPTKLVEPCILAGTSAAGCCSRCGRPWRRKLEVSYQPLSPDGEQRQRRHADPRIFEITVPRVRQARTTGWEPTCECGVDTVSAVVLDPFAGTGTTLAVAQQLGRHALGIELNPDYIQLTKQRLLHQSHPGSEMRAA
jgi:DNA modification methylase